MKTSELKKIVEQNGYELHIGYVSVSINGKRSTLANIAKNGGTLSMLDGIGFEVAKAIIEYAYTPLEEREEEKKYCLKFPEVFIEDYLCKFESNGSRFHGVTLPNRESIFTQKEIDALPKSWQDFFEKVEIK